MVNARSLGFALALASIAVLGTARPAAADIEVRIYLDPKVVHPDGLLRLTIEAKGDGVGPLGFTPTYELENLEVVGGPETFEETSWNSAEGFVRILRHTWTLHPLGPGPAGVKNGRISIRGRTRVLPDRMVSVDANLLPRRDPESQLPDSFEALERFLRRRAVPPSFPGSNEPSAPASFLRAEVSSLRPFVGQQVLYMVYFYSRYQGVTAQPARLPSFRGFWRLEVPLPNSPPTEVVAINGVRYGRWPAIAQVLFPLQPGPTVIDRATYSVQLDDSFAMGPTRAQLTANPVPLEIQPLPPAPSSFAGAVGDFSVRADLRPRDLRQGESALLEISMAGMGRLGGLDAPKIRAPQGLRILPPEQSGSDEVQGSVVQGQRTWKYLIVPTRTGRFVLEPPEISVFVPESGSYRTERLQPIEMRVAAPFHLAPSEPSASTRARLNPKPVDLSKTNTQPSSAPASPTRSPWTLVVVAGVAVVVGAAGAAGALGVHRMLRGRAARANVASAGALNPERAESAQRLGEKLRTAETESRSRAAAQGIEEAWREYLGAILGQAPPLQPARWPAALAAAGADAILTRELTKLAEDLHYLRWAPELAAVDDLRRDLVRRSLALAKQLG